MNGIFGIIGVVILALFGQWVIGKFKQPKKPPKDAEKQPQEVAQKQPPKETEK